MTKRAELNSTLQFTARVHRQHSSLVVTLPYKLCRLLDISRSDILVFEYLGRADAAMLYKLKCGEWYNEPDKGDRH